MQRSTENVLKEAIGPCELFCCASLSNGKPHGPFESLRVACEARYCRYSTQRSIFQITEASFTSVFLLCVFFSFLFSFFFYVSKPINLCAIISARDFCSVFGIFLILRFNHHLLSLHTRGFAREKGSRAEPPFITRSPYYGLLSLPNTRGYPRPSPAGTERFEILRF